MSSYKLIVLIFVLIIIVFWHLVFNCAIDVSTYEGDGSIAPIGTSVISRGYKVDFGKFKLKDQFDVTYNITSFPNLKKDYEFYVRVFSNYDDADKLNFDGDVNLVFLTLDDVKIYEINAPLSKWLVTSVGFDNFVDYYYLDAGQIPGVFKNGNLAAEPIKIKFSYTPKGTTQNENIEAELILRVGGYI